MNVPAITAALLCSLGGAQQDPLERIFQHASEVKRQQSEKPRRGINFSFQELRLLSQPLCLHLHWGFDLAEGETASDVLEDKYVLQEADGSQSSHPATRRYHYAAHPLAVTSGSVTSWLNVDVLGSVTDATSTTGSVVTARQYDAWGQYRNGTAPTPLEPKLGYTGHQFDVESGLIHAGARYYDPELGIWLSRDSYEGQLFDAPSLHRYTYVKNNPVRYVDPDGHAEGDTVQTQIDRIKRLREEEARTKLGAQGVDPFNNEQFNEQFSDDARAERARQASEDPASIPTTGDAAALADLEASRLGRIERRQTVELGKAGAKLVVIGAAVYYGGEVVGIVVNGTVRMVGGALARDLAAGGTRAVTETVVVEARASAGTVVTESAASQESRKQIELRLADAAKLERPVIPPGGGGGIPPGGGAPGQPRVMNLGSGQNPMPGAVNVDRLPVPGVDVQASSSQLPFRSGAFDEVNAINPAGSSNEFFNPLAGDVSRVLRPGGTVNVVAQPRNYAFRMLQRMSPDELAALGFERVGGTVAAEARFNFGTARTIAGNEIDMGVARQMTFRRLPNP